MKIRVCVKCSKKFDEGYNSCPHCGSLKFVEYVVEEKIEQKHCAFCGKTYAESYRSCPYCGSTKIKKEEVLKEEKVVEEEKVEEIVNDERQSSKICEDCGNMYSLNSEKCPYCGSTKTANIGIPEKRICDNADEWKKFHQKRRERNEYLKGFYVGSDTDIVSHEILKGKKLGKKFKEGMSDGLEVRVIGILICAVIGLIVAVVGIILHME